MQSTFETRALAQSILDQITEHPETHDQKVFDGTAACGTTHCIAGWAAALDAGVAWIDDHPLYDADYGYSRIQDGEYRYAEDKLGGELLGLNSKEAIDIFYDTSNESALQKLKHIVVGEEWL